MSSVATWISCGGKFDVCDDYSKLVKPKLIGSEANLQFKTVMNPQCSQDADFTFEGEMTNPKKKSEYGLLDYDL